jgi:hypothetical protein
MTEAFLGHSDEAIRSILHDAMANPEVARNLLAKAAPKVLQRVMELSQRDGGRLWRLVAATTRRGLPVGGMTERAINQPSVAD